MLASALLAACAAAAASLASAQLPNPATRVYLSDASLAAGARALDGSRGVYYVARGAETAKFVIWQRGGGWCTSNENCAERALTMLGSSAEAFCPPSVDLTTYDESLNFKQLSNNASVNPQAWNWTKVFLPYLDGGSQTGDRTDAVPAGGNRSIFYRGASKSPYWLICSVSLGFRPAIEGIWYKSYVLCSANVGVRSVGATFSANMHSAGSAACAATQAAGKPPDEFIAAKIQRIDAP